MRFRALILAAALCSLCHVVVAQEAPATSAPVSAPPAPAGSVVAGAPAAPAPAPQTPAPQSAAPVAGARREDEGGAPAAPAAAAAPASTAAPAVPPAQPSGIIARLGSLLFGPPRTEPAASAAPDEIAQLRSQVATLTQERDAARGELAANQQGVQALIDRLQSERAALPDQARALAMQELAGCGVSAAQLPSAQPVQAAPPAPKLEGRELSQSIWEKKIITPGRN